MYFDLLNTTNTLSSRLVSLEAVQLVQSKIRWSNLRFSPVCRNHFIKGVLKIQNQVDWMILHGVIIEILAKDKKGGLVEGVLPPST